ncbi:MAG: TonB-dependent receptor [Maricaulaceae bacterium]
MRTKLIATTSMIGLLAGFAAPTLAQVAEDEVIVTATRRAESIQDVPIAVTAIQPADLEKQGVVNIQNLGSVAPSFSTSNSQTSSGTVVLRIRGIGTTSNNIGFESAVGVFIDGAYQSRSGVALGEFVDVERVEVLRGPQGTLFGRNTSAGALNITNARPNLDEFGGFINATYGNYDHTSLQGAVNIPLAEGKVAARLTGAIRNRDGYVKVYDRNGQKLGESNGIDQYMLRGQIGFEGDSGIEGRVIVDYSQSTAVCCSAVEVLRSPVEAGGLFGLVGLGARGGMVAPNVATSASDTDGMQAALDDRIASSNQLPESTAKQHGFAGEIKYPISDNTDMVYIGSYRDYNVKNAYDSAFSGLDIFNVVAGGPGTDINTMTHELRFQGDAMDDRLSWLVGGYYSDEEISQQANFELGADYGELIGALLFPATGGAFGANPLTVLSGGVDPEGVSTSNRYTQDSKSWSIFTHNVFDVTDKLSATLGLRYSDEKKDGGFNQVSNNNPLCTGILSNLGGIPAALRPTVIGTGCFAFTAPADLPQSAVLPLPRSFNETFKDDELIYTGKLSYEVSPAATVYGGFTHGYKSGGFNLDSTAGIPVAGVSDPSFDSEEVDAFELGLKSKLMDGRITFNVAAFLEDFKNFQVLEFTGAQFVTFNVPKAQTKGVEIETSGRLTDNFSFNGGLTLLKAAYPDDCAGTDTRVNVTSLCGNTMTNAPKTVGILGATYDGSVNSNMNFFLNGQLRYEGDRRTSTQAVVLATQAPNPFDVQDSNLKINLRAGLTSAEDVWALEAWATNLTNEITRGVTFGTTLRSGSRSAFVQEPRMFGMTARRKF